MLLDIFLMVNYFLVLQASLFSLMLYPLERNVNFN